MEAGAGEPIAIIGMGCRFPGAENPTEFWKLSRDGIDAITEIPGDRFDIDAYYDPRPGVPGKASTRWGGFVRDIDRFDADFFGIAPREVEVLDPQQRLLLEVAWEALEDAGVPPEAVAGSNAGVFIGVSHTDFSDLQIALGLDPGAYFGTGRSHSLTSNRLSYIFDLHGPSLAVDTACSSSLVAAHLACGSLRRNECDLALVGGVNVVLTPHPTVAYSQAHMLSSDGRCKAFDASADGYVRSDGCGVIVLKRLSAAVRDGDPVVAIIRGTATNEDGRTSGVMVPNARAQEAVIRDALRDAGLHPGDIDYVEAHGTGTPVGDPLEVEALKAVLTQDRPPDRPVIVGSVKTNIGHTETAAGVAGIIRAALILRHREVPPHLHLKELNPAIDLADTPLRIVRERTPMKRNGRPLRAGINSFGFGGSNGHLILEEAPTAAPAGGEEIPRPELLTLSARTPEALDATIDAYRVHLAGVSGAPSVRDICFTASVRRTHHAERLALVGASAEELIEQLEAARNGESRKGLSRGSAGAGAGKLAFVFSGMGTQWLGMGRGLLEAEPVFREALERCDAAVRRYASWSVCDEIRADEEGSRLGDIEILQPVLFSIAVGLTDLWRSWGIEPHAVVGHSVGEIAAACAAGALSLEEAARVVCARAASLRPAGGEGAMLSVGLPVGDVTGVLDGREGSVSIGVVNSPTTTVLSGDPAALREIEAQLDGQGVFCRFVKSDIAFHSPQMEPLLESFQAAMGGVLAHEPAVPIYSTVTAGRCEGRMHDASYWLRNFRQPVAFSDTIGRMLEDGYDTFVEISPHPVLTHVIGETASHMGKSARTLPSLRRQEDERRSMLQSLGALYVEGHPVRFTALYPAGGRCVSLPLYPWQRERFWIDDRGGARRRRAGGTSRPLLGEPVVSAAHAGTLVWEIEIDPATFPYLADHVVGSSILFPAAAFAEMALAVAPELMPGPHALEHLSIEQGLVLFADSTATLQIVAGTDVPGVASLQFLSRGEDDSQDRNGWTLHATATVRSAAQGANASRASGPPEEIEAGLDRSDSAAEHYRHMTLRGLSFGPAFQAVESVRRNDAEAVGRIRLPEEAGSAGGYSIHPVLLDACFQTFSTLSPLESYLPSSIAQLRVYDAPAHDLWVHAKRLTENKYEDELEGEIRLFNGDGQLVADVLGFHVQRRRAQSDDAIDDWLYGMRWEPRGRPDGIAGAVLPEDRQGSWLILAGEDDLGERLASLLEAQGGTCTLAHPGDAYERLGPRRFRINPCSREDFSRMLAETIAGQPPLRGVVHLWAQDVLLDSRVTAGSIQEVQDPGTIAAMHLVQALGEVEWASAPQLWLVTRGAQAVGGIDEAGLAQSPLLGFGRVLATELPEFRCTRIDLDSAPHAEDADRLLAEMLAGDREDEVAVRGGTRYVSRLARYRPASETGGDPEAVSIVTGDTPIRLTTSKPGILDNLGFRPGERRSPGPGEVEIRVHATGLNFRDVMSAMGILPGYPDGLGPLGYECSGVVLAVGEDVTEFGVGDEVVALTYNAFRSYVTADARLTVKKPAGVTFDEAVTIPITFMTAQYALRHLARLEAGERVLVHAAAGGVGLAAVQIAQAAGAEIFATAGSPEKRDFLRSLGIAHVMDSRSLDFADEIMRITDGGGVDVVLNSLAGEFIPKSLSVLGPYGRFLEIGRRDIYENSPLGLYPFQRNLSFFAIDLDRLFRERPAFTGTLLREVMAQVGSGSLHPLPRTVYPAGEVVDAFRQMAQAKQIGKVVVSFDGAQVPVRQAGELRFRADASYLITGGTGGLGLKVARWMAERGARSLVLVSRRGATLDIEPALKALRDTGCRVTCARVDVAREDEVAGLLSDIEALPPLRGVIHAAGVIDDTTVGGLTRERIERVMAPKIAGAWNLHRLTQHMPLDHFVLFSSLATAFGNGGQGNYAAANQFLDTLSHFRRQRGLPALSIAWGPWSEVGMVSSVELLDRLMAGGVMAISPHLGLTAMERLLPEDTAHVVVASIDWQRRIASIPGLAAQPFLSSLAEEWTAESGAGIPSSVGPRDALAATAPEDRKDAVEGYLREAVAKVMGIAAGKVAPEKPLTSLGLDSLMAVELRTRIRLDLDVDIPARAFLDGISIERVGTMVLMHLSMGEPTGSGTVELEEITL